MPALTETSSAYLLGLAQGLSAVLAISSGVLIFLGERTVRRFRAKDSAYVINLALLACVSALTALIAALTWSTWANGAPDLALLFGWRLQVWLGLVFGGLGVAAVACFVAAVVAYLKFRRPGGGWDP